MHFQSTATFEARDPRDKPSRLTQKSKQFRARVLVYLAIVVGLCATFMLVQGYTWQGDIHFHTLTEVVATLVSLTVGVMAMARYYVSRSSVFLFIGAGFLGTSMLDGYHALITSSFFISYFPAAPAYLVPWSWIGPRLLLSVLMFLSWIVWNKERKFGERDVIPERTVYIAVIFLAFETWLFLAFVPLPQAISSGSFVHRPQELVPALFFLLALVGYLYKGHWRTDRFEHWLVIALIINFVAQAIFMAFSDSLFDMESALAHLLKIVSYGCVLVGLFISMYRLFKQEEHQKGLLAVEVMERERFEEAFREMSEENAAIAEIGRIASSSLDINEAFVLFLIELRRLVKFDQANIDLIDHESGAVTTKHHFGDGIPEYQSGARTGSENSRIQQVLSSCESLTCADISEDSSFSEYHTFATHGLRSQISVPMVSKEKIVGVLHLRSREISAYGMQEQMLLVRVVNRITPAVVNAVLYEETVKARETLQKYTEELARSNAELEQFAYVASHDLQEPLRSIVGFTSLLTRRYASQLDEDADRFAERIVNAATRMQALISALLGYSRLGRDLDEFTEIDCGSLVQQEIGSLEAAIQDSGAVVTYDPQPTLQTDVSLLSQVFRNLIGNAIKFRGEEAPRIHISAKEKEGEWEFSVRDNGIGIEPEYSQRIFTIFKRLHTREKYEGTGIGLSVCKKAVERLGGRIWVESRAGEGCTFYFTLPIMRDEKCLVSAVPAVVNL